MNNDTQLIILISTIILILTFAITVFVIVRRKHQKNTEKSGVFGEFSDHATVKFTHHEKPFTYTIFPHANKSPSYLTIETACRTTGAFKIQKETRLEKFFKWLNVNKEIQTGDLNFDDKLYVITEETDFTKRILFSSKVRHSINSLFSMGITHVTVNINRINAIIEPFDKSLSETDILKIADLLSIIVSQLPENHVSVPENTISHHPYRIPQHREVPFKGPWSGKRIFSYATSLVLLTAGSIVFGIGLSTYTPLDPLQVFIDSLNYSIPLLILTTWLIIVLLRGRANSHIDFLVVFSFNLFAIPFSTVGGMFYVNGSQDISPIAVHEAIIHHKYYRSDKNGKTYYVSVKSWRDGVNVEDIRVNKYNWQRTKINNSKISLSTQKGYLGYEWLQSYKLIDG